MAVQATVQTCSFGVPSRFLQMLRIGHKEKHLIDRKMQLLGRTVGSSCQEPSAKAYTATVKSDKMRVK